MLSNEFLKILHKLYPVFGDKNNPQDGHGGFAVRGSDVWGVDVMNFLKEALPH